MSAKDREHFTGTARSLENDGEAIGDVGALRQNDLGFETEAEAKAAALPDENAADRLLRQIRERSDVVHARLDSMREDLKAMHAVRAAELDRFMWRVVWEQTQKQRADDQRSQSRYNQITLTCSIFSLAIAVAAVVVTWAHK